MNTNTFYCNFICVITVLNWSVLETIELVSNVYFVKQCSCKYPSILFFHFRNIYWQQLVVDLLYLIQSQTRSCVKNWMHITPRSPNWPLYVMGKCRLKLSWMLWCLKYDYIHQIHETFISSKSVCCIHWNCKLIFMLKRSHGVQWTNHQYLFG